MEKIKKIKEDIDLKELEKYGYKKEDGIIYIKYTNNTYHGYPIVITINSLTRFIRKSFCWTCTEGSIIEIPIVRNNKDVKPDKYIKDLIKAGYVEEI
nr:MAG TPA: hypothetical protein [Caudoviricetes sp.]